MQLSEDALHWQRIQEQINYWDNLAQYGYTIFFITFGIGVVLLCGAALLPRATVRPVLQGGARVLQFLSWHRVQVGLAGLVLLLFLTAISQQTSIDQRRGFIADQEKRYEKKIKDLSRGKNKDEALRMEYLYLPEGDSLTYLSLGNTALAADYVWLTSQQYVSNSFRRGNKFEMLARFYRTVLELNPHWIEAAVNGGKVLSALEPDRWKVERFYIDAMLKNPDDWKLAYEAGRLFVVPPNDRSQLEKYSATAVHWLDVTLKRRTLPPGERKKIDDLKARLSLEAGFYESAAELLLKNALDRENPEAFRLTSARDWLNAQSIVDEMRLQKAINKFKEANGRWPANLDEMLKRFRIPERMKQDRFGYPMEYNPESGRVASRGVRARLAIQAHSMVTLLIHNFRITHAERAPRDLQELQAWVREWFAQPFNPPSVGVTEAIGTDLNVLSGPLGPWVYDAAKGAVVLAEDCNAQQLYRNAKEVLEWMAPPEKD